MYISCPMCDNSADLALIKKEETIEVRKEPITIPTEFYKCSKCGEEFRVIGLGDDPLDKAYRIYRSKHGMLQSEDIRAFRRQYGLTQSELANLLGLGGATISRYEHGQLQDKTHDTLIRMSMDPVNLRELVQQSSDVFSFEKRNRLLRLLDGSMESGTGLFSHVISATFENHECDEYSGFKKFDNERFLNSILYLCKYGVIKTKLNKLLFYFDFKHCKEYTVSSTGVRYAHVPFGPAPDGYELYYPILVRQGLIEVEEVSYQGKDYTGERYLSKQEPNLNIFTDSELSILLSVNEFFKDYNASEMSEFSHDEKGYQDTENGNLISYRYAEDLKI